MVERLPNAPLDHSNEAEHRRLIALRANNSAEEAPVDGLMYARIDGAWQLVTGGTTIDHFQVQDDGSTGQLTTGAATDLTGIWAAPVLGAGFSFAGGVLTVDTASDVVEFDILVHSWNNLNNRHELHVQLMEQVPAGSYAEVVEASTYTSRNNTQDEGSVIIPGFKRFSVAAGTNYKLRVFHIGVAATVGAAAIAGQTYLSAKRYS